MKTKNLVLLLALVLTSAISVVYVRHQNRVAYVAMQEQKAHQDALQTDWGKLMIESATWTAKHNVTVDAGQTLSMVVAEPGKIVVVDVSSTN